MALRLNVRRDTIKLTIKRVTIKRDTSVFLGQPPKTIAIKTKTNGCNQT